MRHDDPKVIEAAQEEAFQSALYKVKAAAEKVRTDHDPTAAAGALDALAQAVADARKLLGGAPQTDADIARARAVAEED